jgi:iron complex outermembrane receptor protein
MRVCVPSLSAVAVAVSLSMLPRGAFAQLEEIVVTAQRRETNLQSTPISIQAFSAEALDLGGIQTGADLGIMVPNLVANPSGAGGGGQFFIRGLPGVGIYIDGIWQSTYGFLESNFAEVERVEVLRGPQGTLFGRNTNGGAISITTRAPSDEFGMRMNLEIGEYNRRNATIAADLPLSPTLKSKWMVSSRTNDGWLHSLTLREGLAGQDDQLFRGDLLWEPTDRFSLRFTANDEKKRSTDARIVRFTNVDHPQITRYNVLAGNPDYLARARAVDPNFPESPFMSYFPSNRFTPESHQPGYPGGEVGKWETKSDNAPEGLKRDLQYYTATMNWDITDNISLESITSVWEMDRRVTVDYDGSEFTFTVDENRSIDNNSTQEFHLTGTNLDDRVTWLAGLYNLKERTKSRSDRWSLWDLPRQPGDINGAARNRMSQEACQYIFDWVTRAYSTATLPAAPAGGYCGGNNAASVIGSLNPNLWTRSLVGSTQSVAKSWAEQKALFGEVTIGLTEKLDMTFGVRITEDSGSRFSDTTPLYIRNEVSDDPRGDIFGYDNVTLSVDPDFGRNTTNKFALQYQLNDDVMLYTSWGEGFTEAAETVNNLPVIAPSGCPNTVVTPITFPQSREVVTSSELGLRSDWLDSTLRFNASYFTASWDGMRVATLYVNPCTGQREPQTITKSDGKGEASGFEFEVVYVPTDRLSFNVNLGLLDTQYLATGAFTDTGFDLSGPIVMPLTAENGTGIASLDSAFAYAADESLSLGVQYDQPLSSGASLTYVGNYGWMSKYVRDTANHRIPRDANGQPEFEPAYGLLNGRLVYTPSEGNWTADLWVTNITDKQYVNGGFDTHTVWGYNFSVIGPPRQAGIGLNMRF